MYFPLVETLSIATLLIPSIAIFWLLKAKARDKVERIVNQLLFWSIILFTYLAAPWAFLSYYLRYLLIGICAVVSIFTLARMRGLPLFAHQRWLLTGLKLFIIATFLVLDITIAKGGFYRDNGIELSFPLKGGRFYVLQGGDNPITNFFHGSNRAQRFALDIVKLNMLGSRARGIYPRMVSKYEIFRETVYTPCEGVVVNALDGIPDLTPPLKDTMNPAGNFIELECKGYRVFMAHMMNGSIKVTAGQHVKSGEAVGRVGNSGNTTEPHLHIHAIRSERGSIVPVPLLFDKRLLSMNSVFVNP